eukprot:scaffold1964_cov252-Isochrysis_galbana.AAC.15
MRCALWFQSGSRAFAPGLGKDRAANARDNRDGERLASVPRSTMAPKSGRTAGRERAPAKAAHRLHLPIPPTTVVSSLSTTRCSSVSCARSLACSSARSAWLATAAAFPTAASPDDSMPRPLSKPAVRRARFAGGSRATRASGCGPAPGKSGCSGMRGVFSGAWLSSARTCASPSIRLPPMRAAISLNGDPNCAGTDSAGEVARAWNTRRPVSTASAISRATCAQVFASGCASTRSRNSKSGAARDNP